MSVIRFPNPHGVHAPPLDLPDSSTHAAEFRRRMGMHRAADEVSTAPAPWHEDILAAAGARMAGVHVSGPMPLDTEPGLPRRPYIAAGLGQQGRMPSGCRAMTHEELRHFPWGEHSRPGGLTAAEIDRHVKAKMDHRPLGRILLDTGAVTWHRSGKPRPSLKRRICAAVADRLANLIDRALWALWRERESTPTLLERLRSAWHALRVERMRPQL